MLCVTDYTSVSDTDNEESARGEREMESPFNADLLKGKVALLTGGGSGIGFEISTQFGKHGASIAIMGRRKQVLDTAVSALHSLGIPVHFLFLTFSLAISRFYSPIPSVCVLLFLFLYLLLFKAPEKTDLIIRKSSC